MDKTKHQCDQHTKWIGMESECWIGPPDLFKEALHIERTPANNRLNRDGGYKLPGCWIATMNKLGGRGNRAGASVSAPSRMGAQAQ